MVVDEAPRSGVRMADFLQRAAEGRRRTARVLQVIPASEADDLEAHPDPFNTAVDTTGEEVEVA